MKLAEAKLATSGLVDRYDEFIDSSFVKDTEGTRLNKNLVVGHFSLFVGEKNSMSGAYIFETSNSFDHELTKNVSCPRCKVRKGTRCKGYNDYPANKPHRDRFNKTGDLLQNGTITSRDVQLAMSFVKSVLRKNNLPYEELVPGYEADQFVVYVLHSQLMLTPN